MIDMNVLDDIEGSTVYGSDGSKIGKAGQVYLDDQTGQPAWVTVNTGLFGTNESFVPLDQATYTSDGLTVPFDKDTVKNAPNTAADGHLSPEEERDLYTYYGLGGTDTTSGTTETTPTDETTGQASDRGDDVEDAMTRSEERLEVGTRQVEAGRVRLRKYVVTENVTQTIPVRKEKAVLERVPITEDNIDAATDGPEITEAEHEVVLHEERPVVQKTVEPVERVRVGKEQVQEQETVTDEVRKERIEAEGDIVGDSAADTSTRF